MGVVLAILLTLLVVALFMVASILWTVMKLIKEEAAVAATPKAQLDLYTQGYEDGLRSIPPLYKHNVNYKLGWDDGQGDQGRTL